MCGEKRKKGAVPAPSPESPPRMRGKGPQHLPPALQNGITPAYAGKSHIRSSLNAVSGDHPRVCGEKISFFFTGCSPRGSPPRMRGKVDLSLKVVCVLGITPAYAGKSRCNLPSTAPWKDHPRVCGEKFNFFAKENPPQGSPPRVRGKVGQLENHQMVVGITPACAGKSCPDGYTPCPARDHPRVCGEKSPAAV